MIDPKRLDDFKKLKILVVGDAMVDRYDFCEPVKLSQEAPVPVLRPTETYFRMGGAANLAANIKALGASVEIVTSIGSDAHGKWLWKRFREEGIGGHVDTRDMHTTLKQRVYASGQQICRIDTDFVTERDLSEAVRHHSGSVDAIAIADYNKGVVTEDERFLDAVSTKPFFVDAKRDLFRFGGARLLKLSAQDFDRNVRDGGHVTARDRYSHFLDHVAKSVNVDTLALTLGKDGIAIREAGDTWFYPTRRVEVRDTTGAGDVAMAALTVALQAGWSLADACELANLSAGISVQRLGTTIVSARDIRSAIEATRPPAGDFLLKCLTAPETLSQVRAWQTDGAKVGIVNGCFDLLHPGHLMFLAMARERCDRLVVLINTDESYERIKGRKPTHNFYDRSSAVAAAVCVDAVTGFAMDSPAFVIDGLKPDVYCFGWDHAEDSPECEAAREVGAKCLRLDRYGEHSTTAIKERIRS